MITPNDIQNKVFSNSMRGYNKREVDEFLDEITIDFQKQLDENTKLSAEVKQLNEQIEESKKSQQSVANTLEQAKRLMSDISESAEKRAEVIIKNARLDAQTITRNAKDSVASYTQEAETLQRKISAFKASFREFMEKEQQRVDDNVDDLFSDLEGEMHRGSVRRGEAAPADSVESELSELPDADDILAKAEQKAASAVPDEDIEGSDAHREEDDMDRTKVISRPQSAPAKDMPEDLSRTIVMDRSQLSHTDFDFPEEKQSSSSDTEAADDDLLAQIDEEIGSGSGSSAKSADTSSQNAAFDDKAKTIVVDENEILSRLKR